MFKALASGIRRLAAAPGMLLFVWLVNLLIALPAAVVLEEAIHRSAGGSLARESLRAGFDTGWHGEFKAEAEGLAATFEPYQLGVGAWLDVVDRWWSGRLFAQDKELLAIGLLFGLVWLFLLGGVLERFWQPYSQRGIGELLAAGGRRFFPFLRVTLIAAPLYYGLFRLAGWFFPWLERMTRDLTRETTVLALNLIAAGLVVLLLALLGMVTDYARISMVVAGRKSALAALAEGLSFVARRPFAAPGLVIVFTAAMLGLFALYASAAPGAAETSPLGILGVLVVGQVFLLARLALRLGLMAAELALYEGGSVTW
jgi:hypothetical protein